MMNNSTHPTTYLILGTVVFIAFLIFLGTMGKETNECRKIAMEKSYPAIEIQGICK